MRRLGPARAPRPSVVAIVTLLLCGPVLASPLGADPTSRARAGISGTITVSAGASLTEAFTKVGADFLKRHKRTMVRFNFGSSAALVTQIQGGAPVDVFASADLTNMDKLVTTGTVRDSPTIFARNQLEMAVKPGNPKGIMTLADLRNVGVIALCGPTVPCGVYAANVLSRAGVTIPEASITRGADAKATIAAVSPGDADAALVYVTDVRAAGGAVQGVMIPDDENTVAVYPIARIAGRPNARLAKAFVAYVASPAGRKTLANYGFLAP